LGDSTWCREGRAVYGVGWDFGGQFVDEGREGGLLDVPDALGAEEVLVVGGEEEGEAGGAGAL
jgi:hypothetical protein